MAEILEAVMVVLFGVSWPVSIVKSLRSKTARGKSLLFMLMIAVGYLFGIASKLAAQRITYVLFFYVLNLLMVSADMVLYCINKRRDAEGGGL